MFDMIHGILLLPAAVLCFSLMLIFFIILDKSMNLKIEKIMGSAKHIDSLIDIKLEAALKKRKGSAKIAGKISKLLSETRFKPFGYQISLYMFFGISGVLSVFVYFKTFDILKNTIAGLLLASLALIIPYEILSFEVRRKRRKLRRHLPNFFLVLSQLFYAEADIIEVLDAAVPRIKNPLRSEFRRFVRGYKSGKEIEKCIVELRKGFDNDVLIRFIEDIGSNIEHGGNFNTILTSYINDSYDNEINYNERITENSGNITGVLVILFMFVSVLDSIRTSKPEFINILIYNPYGQLTVDLIIILFVATALIMKYAVSFKDQ